MCFMWRINCVELVLCVLVLTHIYKHISSYICGEHVYSSFLPFKWQLRKDKTHSLCWGSVGRE